MLDWLTWPADLLLDAAGVVVSLFVSKESINFGVIQMMTAVLLLAVVVSLIVYWQSLVQWLMNIGGRAGKFR